MKEKVVFHQSAVFSAILAAIFFMFLPGCDAFDPYGGGFKSYTDSKKTFQVEIPKSYNFKEITERQDIGDGIIFNLRQYEATGRGDVSEYFVHVAEGAYGYVKDRMSVDDFQDQMAAGLLESAFKQKEGKLISQGHVERGGVTTPTLMIKLRHEGQDYWGIADVYVYGDDLFLYGVSGLSADIGSDKNALYFLESFTIPE